MSVCKIGILFSGGVESTCLLYYYLGKNYLVYPIYVRCGFPWERLELENARNLWHITKGRYKNLMPLAVVSLHRKRVKLNSLFIPLRNMTLILSCANLLLSKGIKELAIGSLGIYPFPDNNSEYLKQVEKLISSGAKQDFKLHAPFMGLEKAQVIEKFGKGVPIELTFSCIRPRKVKGRIVSCGACEKCKERQEAISLLP